MKLKSRDALRHMRPQTLHNYVDQLYERSGRHAAILYRMMEDNGYYGGIQDTPEHITSQPRWQKEYAAMSELSNHAAMVKRDFLGEKV